MVREQFFSSGTRKGKETYTAVRLFLNYRLSCKFSVLCLYLYFVFQITSYLSGFYNLKLDLYHHGLKLIVNRKKERYAKIF